ncbi:MAG: hypothetical protein ACR2H5_25535 [Ktedonobacteraceae bacterium]
MKSMMQERRPHTHNWVRRVEHGVLRGVSFVFSVVSAHAILWFFSALDWVDPLQPFVKWGLAIGFGILGYFVSRGLAHRLLNKEPVRAYVFICGLFEFVEIVCNYSMAASSSSWIVWLGRVHGVQHTVLVPLVQVVLSIIPLVTVMLAWVDMDLERAKQGYEVRGFGTPTAQPYTTPSATPPMQQRQGVPNWQSSAASSVPPVQRPPQPKQAPVYPTAGQPTLAPQPSYQQGYAPPVARSAVSSLSVPSATSETMEPPAAQGGWFSGLRSNVGKAVGAVPTPFSRPPVGVESTQE